MASDRASTIRQIRSGSICALCRSALPPSQSAGERLCSKCRGERKRHRIYMSFVHRAGWVCQFVEEDLKTPLPRKVHFRDDQKVREIARRGGASLNLETLQAFDHGIEIGRGGIWLELSEEQYRKLL